MHPLAGLTPWVSQCRLKALMAKRQVNSESAPVVWLLTDNKAGHRNQLKGLGNRLRVLAGASLHWLEASTVNVPLWRALTGIPPGLPDDLPHPDLIIAAGSGTHRLLLSLRRLRGSRTLVIMKPAFPTGWVDAAIIPAHDSPRPNRNVFISQGVINTITPLARITDKPEALILIGGPSRHFKWDDDVVHEQVTGLISTYPQWRWTISDSRRTPTVLHARLAEMANLKVTVVNSQQTHENWLNHQLAASRAVWITPDSMSMVCEAITSNVPTGVLTLTPSRGSRVANGVGQLVQSGHLAEWSDHAAVMTGNKNHHPVLWEADRAARWVLAKRLLPKTHQTGYPEIGAAG